MGDGDAEISALDSFVREEAYCLINSGGYDEVLDRLERLESRSRKLGVELPTVLKCKTAALKVIGFAATGREEYASEVGLKVLQELKESGHPPEFLDHYMLVVHTCRALPSDAHEQAQSELKSYLFGERERLKSAPDSYLNLLHELRAFGIAGDEKWYVEAVVECADTLGIDNTYDLTKIRELAQEENFRYVMAVAEAFGEEKSDEETIDAVDKYLLLQPIKFYRRKMLMDLAYCFH